MVMGMYEFLLKVSKLKRTAEKVGSLRNNDTVALRIILQAAFDPSVEFLLPEGTPPYKPNELVDQQHVLHKEADKIRYFVKGFHPNLNQNKREMMFIEFLERLDPKDAELVLAVKEKRLPFPGIAIQHVVEGLPGLIPEDQVKIYLKKLTAEKFNKGNSETENDEQEQPEEVS